MDPDEFMVQPRRLQLRRQVQLRMPAVEFKKTVDFGFDLFGRAVLVNESVIAPRIVRPDLPSAAPQRDFDPPPVQVDAGRGLLMASQKLMPFTNGGGSQRPPFLCVRVQHLQCRLLVLQKALYGFICDFRHGMRAAHPLKSFGDQGFSYPFAKVIEPLNLARFNCETALLLRQPDVHHFSACATVFQPGARFLPLPGFMTSGFVLETELVA